MTNTGRVGTFLLLIGIIVGFMGGCVPQEDARISHVPPPAPVSPRNSIIYNRPAVEPADNQTANRTVQVNNRGTDIPLPPPPPPKTVACEAGWVAAGGPKWTYIIVHHSSENRGNADMYDRAHRRRGWDELGYHFVITNGHGGIDGTVEVGPRWKAQKHGAHVRISPDDDNYWNRFGIGICLVGNFNNSLPTERQMQSTARLIAYLQQQYNIPDSHILGHNQVPGAKTDCPGRLYPYSEIARRVRALRNGTAR